MLSQVDVAHLPPGLNVYIGLFQEVKNAASIREQLINGNSDFEFAFIDAKAILSTTHILAAIFRAINDMSAGRMKSRNVHSEVVFCLSPNNNIAESFRKFGVGDQTTDLIAIKITESGAEPFQKVLHEHLQGQAAEFSDAALARIADQALIRKIYKLPDVKPVQDLAKQRIELELSILGIMALRGAT